MWKLLKQIALEEEQSFSLPTNDFFRPDLKQIGNSIYEIKRHFITEGGRTVTPSNLDESLEEVKDCLLGLVENDALFLGLDPKIDNEIKYNNYPKTEPCFMFLSETLSFALDFETGLRPNTVICDVFIAFPSMPTMVLSIVDGDEDSREALVYNTSVARGVRERLIRFIDEDVNSIHGVINKSTLKESVAFNTRLKDLAADSFHFVPGYSLSMNSRRYDRLLTAFWAGVAETKSVFGEIGEADDDSLRFLTKEQCIILVDNINSKNVEVNCVPGSGATTLMLEVARRLNRLGDTLLVCRSRQERDRLRSVYPSAIAAEDLTTVDSSSCVNIVDETNTVMAQTSGQHWRFTTYQTDVKELKSHIFETERDIEGMEKLIDALSNESWKEQIEYNLRDFSVLKMLSFKLGSTGTLPAHEVRHNLEYEPSVPRTSKGHYASLGGLKQHLSTTRATWLSDLHDGLRQRKNLVPLLRSVTIEDKKLRIYQGVKNVLLRKGSVCTTDLSALGTKKHAESKQSLAMVGHVESPDIQQKIEMFHIEPENVRKESDIPVVQKEGGHIDKLETEVQDTDGKDLESHWDEIKTLNQDLGNLLKDRDRRKGQLHKLYTVELQAGMEYVTRHEGNLSMLDIEIPGWQVDLPDRHESTFPRRVTSGQGTSAVSTVGHEEIGDEIEHSKKKGRRLDISGSVTSQSHNTNTGPDKGQRHTRTPGLINQLRQYEQGRLTEKHLCDITMKIIRDDELQLKELIANNDCLEKDFGNTVHVVGLTRQPLLVSCPKLHLDAARANTSFCHVTPDGELVNRPPDTQDEVKDRLQKFLGTCSSPIPLPPSSSTLTPLPTIPRYLETETRVRVGGRWPVLILEMGVCEAGQVDSGMFVSRQPRSWCVSVGSCDTHQERFCTTVYRDWEQGECHQDTMSPTPGTQATLHFGIVLDVGRGRVAFTDLDRQVVLDRFNVEFREPLVPMFSVGSEYSDHTASMRLISGEDINMTDTKKALIYQALN